MRLIDVRTGDGSRHFARLPASRRVEALREYLLSLPGVVSPCLAERSAAPWVDFTYEGHDFSVRRRANTFCFFVRDPACSDITLCRLVLHCEQLLRRRDASAEVS
jgi:hypothetical protein